MSKFDSHNQEYFRSLVPKSRPSIRNVNKLEIDDFYCLEHSENSSGRKNVYKSSQHDVNFHDEKQYIDDTDDSDENSNTFLSNSSQNVLLDSFSNNTTPTYKRNYHRHNTNRSFNSTTSFSYSVHDEPQKNIYNIFLYSVICIVFLICIVIIQIVFYKDINQEIIKTEMKTKEVHLIEVDKILDKSIQKIQMQFYNQKPSIWNDMSAAIYDVILHPTKPSIITLFGKESSTLNCLAQLLGQLSGKILGSNSYLLLTPKDFPNDVGAAIHNLKTQILEKQAVIIQDLLNVNTEAIKAFHNFCDRENPLVEHAIYIITMVVDDYPQSQKELAFVEKQLIKKLSREIEKDILDPLITRLTDGVIIPILPVSSTNFNLTDCSFPENYRL